MTGKEPLPPTTKDQATQWSCNKSKWNSSSAVVPCFRGTSVMRTVAMSLVFLGVFGFVHFSTRLSRARENKISSAVRTRDGVSKNAVATPIIGEGSNIDGDEQAVTSVEMNSIIKSLDETLTGSCFPLNSTEKIDQIPNGYKFIKRWKMYQARVHQRPFNVEAMADNLIPGSHPNKACMEATSSDHSNSWYPIRESLCHHRFLWLTGIHFSGTSLLNYVMQTHPNVSGHVGTGSPQDEGAFLQNEYFPAPVLGGTCKLLFNDDTYMDEHHPLATGKTRACVFAQWAKYWNLTYPVLVEKSPPTIMQLRFREYLFPGVSASIISVRHPLYPCLVKSALYPKKKNPVHLAFSADRIKRALSGWIRAHTYLQETLPKLERYSVIMFEDFWAQNDAVEKIKGLVSQFFPDVVPLSERRQNERGLPFHAGEASREYPDVDRTLLFSWATSWEQWRVEYPDQYSKILPLLMDNEKLINEFGYSLLNVTSLDAVQFDRLFGSKFPVDMP